MWIALLAFGVSFGQVITNYAFTASSGTFTPITGGTAVATNTSVADFLGDTKTSTAIPIGFTFYYMGVPYTQLVAMSDGYISFNLSATSSLTNNLATSAATQRPLLAPLWDDLDGASGTGAANYITEGAAGSRVFTIEWLNWQWNYDATGATISFQIKLYETTGKIEFIYTPAGGAINSASASIGITGIPTGSGNYLSLDGSGASPVVSSTTETTTIAVLPAAGQIYAFTPPATIPTAATNLTFSGVALTSMTLNWTDSPDETFYIISNSLDGITYTPVTNLPANAVSYQANGLTPSTLYYWKVNATVESGLLSTDLTGSQSTLAQVPLHGIYSINNLFPTTAVLLHDGTDNFNNFTDAINYLNDNGISASVTFGVAAGQTFTEDCPVIIATGTAANTITFAKAGVGANPVVSPTGTTGTADAGFTINGGDYLTFNGIDVTIASGSAVEYGYYIRNASATDGAQHNSIANCKITLNRANTSARGISQYNAVSATDASGTNSYNVYHKNIIENCYHGIQLTGTSSTYPDLNCVIDSNVVGASTANDIGNGSTAANGIRANYQNNITIFGNIVRNVTASSSVYGIYAQYLLGTDNNIGNNIVYSINMTGTGTTTYVYGLRTDINSGAMANIFNNMVSDLNHGITTASSNVVVRGIGAGLTGTGTSNIVHNSVLISEDAAASSAALYLGSSGTHNVLNNVFANASTAGTTSKRYCIYRTTGSTFSSDYNDLYIDAAGTNNFIGYFTADRNTLADWQTASSQDANSISVDPTFNGLTDLHTTNPALNGTAMLIPEITEDIDGEARDTYFPDMGADENLTPVVFTCTTPTPGNTIASSTALCYGDGVLLTLENATAGTGVTYQWQSSTDGITYTNITGATAESYGTIPTAATYFQCVVTCHEGPVSGISTPVLIGFAHEITSSTGASRCGAGTLSLSATASSGTINWYDSSFVQVGTGSPWTTPIITSTTAFYAVAEVSNTSFTGRPAPAATSGDYWTGYGLVFNASKNIVINSVDVYPVNTTPANMTIRLLDNTGTQVAGTADVVFMPNAGTGTTAQTVALNYIVPAGTGYRLVVSAGMGSANELVQETTGYTYPIVNGPVTITSNWNGSYTSSSYYDWFYNWNIALSCSSPVVEVVATIGASPALTLTADQTVCNNSAAQIDVTSTLAEYDSYVWTPETDLYTDAACTTPYVSGSSATTVYVKSLTAGVATYTCTANNSGTGCANIATSNVTVLPGAPVAAASPESICGSGSAAITITPATGWDIATFQWMESTDNATFSDIVGANAISYTTPVITDTMYYKMVVELGAAVCTESNVVTILVKNPQVLSTTPASRCGNGTVTLSATSNSGTDLNWYDAITGGNLLGSGLSFVTPAISSTTSYYVEASYTAPLITAEIGTGTTTGTSATYSPLYTTYESSKQQLLYTASELQSAGLVAGNINSLAFHVSSVSSMAMTNFNVSIGTTALAALTTTFETGLTNVYTSAAYTPADTGWQTILFSTPYAWDGVSNIIIEVCDGNNSGYATGSGVYYTVTPFVSHHYAYDDGVQGCSTTTFDNDYTSSNRANIRFTADNSCTSARTEVVATVTTPPAITVTATPAIICLNETTDLEATSSNTGYSYVWEPGTLSGATQTVTPTGTTTYNVTASDNSGGANDGCVATGSVLVTVNPIPTNVAITASDASLCTGESLQLSASATSETDVILNYTEGFEAWPPVDWTFINNGAGNSWTSYGSAYAGSSSMAYSYDENYAADAWAITPSMNMVSGTSYTISFWYKVYSASYPEDLKITVGSVPSVAGQTTVLWDNGGDTALINTTYSQATITYTPTTSGSYYFGFNCYSEANMWRLYVDSVSISGTTLNPCTYTWTSVPAGFASTDQTPAAFIPTATAQYIVVAENNLGCSASADTTISVNPIPVVNLGSDQAICDTTTITLDAGNAGSTYDWSTGGTAQTEDILGSDLGVGANTVTVDVTSAAGCTGTGSVVITVTVCSGIEDPSMQISYYPNPATNMLNLDLSELPTGDYRFELLNMQGQKVMDKILVNDGNVISVNLMDIAPGSYVISVSGNNNTFRNYLSIQE